jgi:DNA-binding ferritin-like protein
MNAVQRVDQFQDYRNVPFFMLQTKQDVFQPDDLMTALNLCIVNAIDLRFRTKQAHWMCHDSHILSAWEDRFGCFNSELEFAADKLSNRVAALGGTPIFAPKAVAALSKLPISVAYFSSVDEQLCALIASYRVATRYSRIAIHNAMRNSDLASASVILNHFTNVLRRQTRILSGTSSEVMTFSSPRELVH